jgi:hypothetical protein
MKFKKIKKLTNKKIVYSSHAGLSHPLFGLSERLVVRHVLHLFRLHPLCRDYLPWHKYLSHSLFATAPALLQRPNIQNANAINHSAHNSGNQQQHLILLFSPS